MCLCTFDSQVTRRRTDRLTRCKVVLTFTFDEMDCDLVTAAFTQSPELVLQVGIDHSLLGHEGFTVH